MIWNGGTSSWTWITWCRPTWSRRGSDSGCEVRSRAHAGRSSRRPVWLCRRRFNRSNRRLPAGILRLVPRRLCDCATHGSVRRCYCILSKTSLRVHEIAPVVPPAEENDLLPAESLEYEITKGVQLLASLANNQRRPQYDRMDAHVPAVVANREFRGHLARGVGMAGGERGRRVHWI